MKFKTLLKKLSDEYCLTGNNEVDVFISSSEGWVEVEVESINASGGDIYISTKNYETIHYKRTMGRVE